MSEAAPAENNSKDGITKLFIGSLSFKTTKPSLTKAFTDLNVEVKTAKVVRNITGRSMGYGFVEIPEKDVELVISKLHHTELDGRQINIEKATSTKPKRKPKGRVQRTKKTAPKEVRATSPPARTPAPPKEKPVQKQPAAGAAPVKKEKKPPKRINNNNNNSVPRESSETKLYVANIPFALNDAELAAIFSKYGKVEGKVIVNKKTGRSRGYGFVELESAEAQKKAIEEQNKAQVQGRAITVRAAYREIPPAAVSAEPEITAKPEAKTEEKKEAPVAKSPKKNKPRRNNNRKEKATGATPAVAVQKEAVPSSGETPTPTGAKEEKPASENKESGTA